MEQTLDWHLTNFSSKYNKKVKDTYISLSPVILADFGSLSTKWKLELNTFASKENIWNFWLNLLSMDSKPEIHVPVEIQKRVESANQITVQSQLILVKPPDTNETEPEPTVIKCRKLSFGPELTTEGKFLAIGFPIAEDKSAQGDIKCLEKWVNQSNDTLHVRVIIKYIKSAPPITIYSNWPNAHLLNDLSGLLTSGRDSDFVIKCGHGSELETFQVHKFILSLRSPVFQTMLKSDMVEVTSGVITIEDTDPTVMKQFLNFMYTSKVEFGNMSQEDVISLIAAGDKYDVTVCKDMCFQHLLTNLSKETCGQLAVAAYLHNADNWQKNLIYEYVAEHWRTLGSKKEFQDIGKPCPVLAFLQYCRSPQKC